MAQCLWLYPNGQNHTPHCAGTSWRFCFSDKPQAEALRHRQFPPANPADESWGVDCPRQPEGHKKAEDFCRRICTLSQPPCFSKIRCKQSHQNIRDVQNQELFQIDFAHHKSRSCFFSRTFLGIAATISLNFFSCARTLGFLSFVNDLA